MVAISTRPKLNGFTNRIRLVGIELEGGWDQPPEGEVIERDGSVKFPQQPAVRASFEEPLTSPQLTAAQRALNRPVTVTLPVPQMKGEITSKPIAVDKIAGWMTHAYPKYVNETCGLHVHMSFHYRSNYARLMTPDFTAWMVAKVRAFAEAEKLPSDHPQWERVKNPNHPHCAHVYLGPAQIRMTRKDYDSRGKPYSRYTFVNYPAGQHNQAGGGTVEVRGLAMFDTAEVAIRAIMAVLNGTNEFLSKIRQRERPERAVVKPRPETHQEFRTFIQAT